MIRGDQRVAITRHGLSNINNKCYIERYDFIFHYNLFSPSNMIGSLSKCFISLWKLLNTDLLISNKSEMPVCLYELIHGDDHLWVTDDISK